ncbi:MAG TPA: DUF72 domain-containing protein [Spirochaetales bacterium]|nr:DUF72 domain-containing protein [Spirochaetales bacterium]
MSATKVSKELPNDDSQSGCDLRIGTSGYDYPEWEGRFYRQGVGRSEYLGEYSEVFDTVELNFSYYNMPKAQRMQELLSRTRRPIDFAVKANKALTHVVDPASWDGSVREFSLGLEPLAAAGRLCAVLFEFPYSFHYEENERRYLDKVLRAFAAFPLAVEFRNAQWLNARVIEGLRARDVALCALDMPRLEGLPPVSDLVTSSKLAYVRFHGRNEAMWWDGDNASRYDYLYSKDELAGWIPRIETMSTQTQRLRIYFNNHKGANAAFNARDFTRLAKDARLL